MRSDPHFFSSLHLRFIHLCSPSHTSPASAPETPNSITAGQQWEGLRSGPAGRNSDTFLSSTFGKEKAAFYGLISNKKCGLGSGVHLPDRYDGVCVRKRGEKGGLVW